MFLIASCGRDCKGFAPGLPKFEHPALLFRPPSNVPISLCWNENLMTKLAPLLALVLVLAGHGNALADGEFDKLITPADRTRMEGYEATRKQALDEARRGGSPADVRTLDAVLGKEPPQSFSGFDMTGNWQCRTIKVGGLVPLIVYGWFKCKVSDDGSGWMLEKVSGSQRTKGRFYDVDDHKLAYLGSFYVAGETPKPYGSGPDSDQFAYAFRTGAKGFRLEFPAPQYESKLDIIELRR